MTHRSAKIETAQTSKKTLKCTLVDRVIIDLLPIHWENWESHTLVYLLEL